MDKAETLIEKNKIMYGKMYNCYNELKENINKKGKLEKSVENFCEIIEIVIWGEKHQQIFFDFFIEENIIKYFLIFLNKNKKTENDKDISLRLIKTYSFFIVNLKNIEMTNYVFSNSLFNEFIKFDFDFKNEEIVFFYINFVKSLSQKFDQFPFEIFYNSVL